MEAWVDALFVVNNNVHQIKSGDGHRISSLWLRMPRLVTKLSGNHPKARKKGANRHGWPLSSFLWPTSDGLSEKMHAKRYDAQDKPRPGGVTDTNS